VRRLPPGHAIVTVQHILGDGTRAPGWPDTGAVARVATLPQPLSDPNAVTVGRRIVVLGGGTNAVYALTAHG